MPTSIRLIVHMVTHLISHSNPKSEREVKKLTPYHSASMHRAVTHTRPTGSRTHTCCHSSSVVYFYFVMSNSHALAEKWVKSCLCVWVAQSCLTLCNPMDCSSLGYSVPGILQERILEWVAIPFSRGSSQLRGWTRVSHIAGRFFTIWTTREAQTLLRRVCIWSFLCDPVPLSARKRRLPTSRAYTVTEGGWKMNSFRRTFPEAAFPCITHSWAYSAGYFKTGWEDQHHQFSSVQLLSHVWLCATPWTVAR